MIGRRRATGEAALAYTSARAPSPSLRWREVPYAVADLETTGLYADRHEIISIGVVPIDAGRARPGAGLYRLVRPVRMPTEETIRVHGIRPADLAEAAPLEGVIDDVLAALAGRVMVAHVELIERTFLTAALRPRGVKLRGPILDTQLLGREWLADGTRAGPRLDLPDLAERLGLPAHRAHHALGDAVTTAQVFLALAAHLDRRRPGLTLRRLTAMQRAVRQER